MSRRSWKQYSAIAFLLVVAIAIGGWIYWRQWSTQAAPTYKPRDAMLAKEPLYFYPAVGGRANAFLFFFGNDVAFWEPHQMLANRLSHEGYAVVGMDLRKYLDELPDRSVPARDSAFAASIGPLIARARHEIGADSLPIVIGGHSFGAEVALWTAMHEPPRKLVGVLAMSTRGAGHFFVRRSDWENEEPAGEGSFSTVDLVRDIPPAVRIAVVRGQRDKFGTFDSSFAAVGGARFRRYWIPSTGHSIRSLIVAGPFIERALSFLTDSSEKR
jgi:pimeloyl-ACP methyl ester carboxylesterase